MKISIYGCGYVGLVTGVCLARIGHSVICYDIDKNKIDKLDCGIATIFENHFDNYFRDALNHKRLAFSSDIKKVVAFADIHMIAVGTPSQADGSANLSHVFEVIDSIIENIEKSALFIIKSTVPVGTTEIIRKKLIEDFHKKQFAFNFEIAFLPEFFQQGNAINTFMQADRVIVGTDSDNAFQTIKSMFEPLNYNGKIPLLKMSTNSAELSKYAANAFLAAKISFINEISRIAELSGADIKEVAQGMSYDKRIGSVAQASCGFGGSCLPKDLKALISLAEEKSFTSSLLPAVLKTNENQKEFFFDKIKKIFNNEIAHKTLAIWGLSFKAHTDDIREAVSCDLIENLLSANVKIQAYDPAASLKIKALYPNEPNLTILETKEKALQNADALIVLSGWEEFCNFDYSTLKNLMHSPIVLDGYNIYNSDDMLAHGIRYYGVGCGLTIDTPIEAPIDTSISKK